ncbi:MAG: hypothetical protein RL726_1407, partial [Actinomycetota bacterium]
VRHQAVTDPEDGRSGQSARDRAMAGMLLTGNSECVPCHDGDASAKVAER